jgi:hypothetical protein
MTKDSGQYGRTVPEDDPRDTRPDLKDTCVILDIRFRDGSKFTGWKEYVGREEWAAADDETRTAIITKVAAKLLDAIRMREQ